MVGHALDRNHKVVGVCRQQNVGKLDAYRDRIVIARRPTNDPAVISRAVAELRGRACGAGARGDGSPRVDTAQAVLDHVEPGARLVFSCGRHVSRGGADRYSRRFRRKVATMGWVARRARVVDLADQVEATRRVFDSDTRWTVVRAGDLEEGPSQGLPVWSRHVGQPALEATARSRRGARGCFEGRMADVTAPHRKTLARALLKVAGPHDRPSRVAVEHPPGRRHLIGEIGRAHV